MSFGIQGIDLKSLSLSTHYLRLHSNYTDAEMATGTGFIYEFKEVYYLITNGHNFTRVNPVTGENMMKGNPAYPASVSTLFRKVITEGGQQKIVPSIFKLKLYLDDEYTRPGWFIHPIHGYNVDVVALPIMRKEEVPPQVDLWPINSYEFDSNIPPQAGDDIFILGYPYNVTGGGELPIWKRGSIATEPFVDLDSLPKMLVDTASKSGMSGSPVIMSRTGFIQNGDTISLDSFFGTIRRFVGVYSGRIMGDDSRDAQLGVVWKEHVVQEILEAKVTGTIEFQSV